MLLLHHHLTHHMCLEQLVTIHLLPHQLHVVAAPLIFVESARARAPRITSVRRADQRLACVAWTDASHSLT